MPTNPPRDLYDPELSIAAVRELIGEGSSLLREIVAHGVAILRRCAYTSDGGDLQLGILTPYYHVLEMVDAANQLAEGACASPAVLPLRSAFEAMISLEYILATETEQRAFAYLVADMHRRLSFYHSLDPERSEGQRVSRARNTDSYMQGVPEPPVPDVQERIDNLKVLLSKPGWADAEQEWQRIKNEKKRTPKWHELYGGPRNLEQLASRVNASYHYERLYRVWSMTAHAMDLSRQFAGRRTDFSRIRDASSLSSVYVLAATFGIRSSREVLHYYRPHEKAVFARWYKDEIQAAYMKLTQNSGEKVQDIDSLL